MQYWIWNILGQWCSLCDACCKERNVKKKRKRSITCSALPPWVSYLLYMRGNHVLQQSPHITGFTRKKTLGDHKNCQSNNNVVIINQWHKLTWQVYPVAWHTSTTCCIFVWLHQIPVLLLFELQWLSIVFSMAINNRLPWVLSSFNKQAQITEIQTQQHVTEVNYYSLPGRSSRKLVSTFLIKTVFCRLFFSAVRNELVECDWKAENFKENKAQATKKKHESSEIPTKQTMLWKEKISVLVQMQLYEIIFTDEAAEWSVRTSCRQICDCLR